MHSEEAMASKKQDETSGKKGFFVPTTGTPVYVKTGDICPITGNANQWIGQLVSQGVLHKSTTTRVNMFHLETTIRAY